MLTNPFTGKELFTTHEFYMRGHSKEIAEDMWEEEAGKSKKQAWNNLAKIVNERMRSEPSYIKGKLS